MAKKKSLAPIKKPYPVESIDKIPTNTATLADYEKMAKVIAESSDDIIDRALDRMESRPVKDKTPPMAEAPVEAPQQESEPTNESNGKAPVDDGVIDGECGEAVVAKLKAKILKLTTENDELRKKLSNNVFEAELKKLETSRDDLLLRNSELEFEISRLGTENQTLKNELNKAMSARNLPPQTYSPEAYTRVQKQNIAHGMGRPPVRGMNGYESWN